MNKRPNHDTEARWLSWIPGPLRSYLEDSETLKKILGNTSWLMVERVVNLTIRFFVGVWVVRYLGPENYGVYSYALSFVALFAAFATLGLDSIVVRNLARSRMPEGEIIGTAFGLRVGAAGATMIAIAVTVFSVADETLIQLAVLLVSAQLVFKSADVFDLWFQSRILSKYPAWIRSGVTILFAASQVVFIVMGLPVLWFLVLVVLQSALQVIGVYLMYRYIRPEHGDWSFRLSTGKKMLADAWPLIFAGLSVSVYMKIDQVMLGHMIGQGEVGIYATAVKVSELWYFVPLALAGSVYPKIVSSKEQAASGIYEKRMQLVYDLMAALSYCIIIPLALIAEPLVTFLFGTAYSGSAPILTVHIWALLFVSLGVARNRWLTAENLTRFTMVATLLGAVINVGLNLVLIPAYAGLGSAWATLVSQIIATYAAALLWPPLYNVFYQQTKAILLPFRLPAVYALITNEQVVPRNK